jgi:integrase
VSKARGTVVKRGDRFSVVLDLGRDENGKRIRKWHSGYADKDEAERGRTELLRSVDTQEYVAPSRLTVRQFTEERWLPHLDGLVAAEKLKPSTVAHYRRLLNAYVLPRIGRKILRDLTADELTRMYGVLLAHGRCRTRSGSPEPLSRTTVHACHVAVHKMLKDAVRFGLVVRNVADVAAEDAPRPEKPDLSERTWTPEELGRFLSSVTSTRLASMWELFAVTGMRRGEVCGLRWSALDLDAGIIDIVRATVVINHKAVESTPKTKMSVRCLALDPDMVRALRAYKRRQAKERLSWGPDYRQTDLVFTWEDGRALHPDVVTKTFQRLARKAGLRPIPVHGLRHSFATAARLSGMELDELQLQLGHSSITVTSDLYVDLPTAVVAEKSARAAGFIRTGGAG